MNTRSSQSNTDAATYPSTNAPLERKTHFALLLDDDLFQAVLELASETKETPFEVCARVLRDGVAARKAALR